jgi:hypothetical protein
MRSKVCRITGWVLLTTLPALACGGTSVTELTGPDAIRCQLALDASSATVPAAGAQLTVGISVERDCTWNAQSNASWVRVSPAAGQGGAAVNVAVDANTSTSSRTAAVLVNAHQFQVTQNGASPPPPPPCTFTLSPMSREIDEDGGVRSFRVTTGPACAWTASTTVPWIAVTSSKAGTGVSDVTYRVDRNRSPQDRVGAVVISGAIHLVYQSND